MRMRASAAGADQFGQTIAAGVEDGIRRAGPLIGTIPALGRGPGLVATVVLPVRQFAVALVFCRGEQLAGQFRVDEEVCVIAPGRRP